MDDMQREGNCPLNACARALGAVKEAIAYSMATLLLAEKLGTFIQSNYITIYLYVFSFMFMLGQLIFGALEIIVYDQKTSVNMTRRIP